ncbi:MAG: DNA methyltransferase [Mogibacterium kristiansenii]|uniref:DNA methyltransferase n=1 Tax=Mogibacterium kristiansenii TaxID=2606708 RepID=UPI003F0C56A7
MTDAQQRASAKAFAKNWKDRGYEKGDSQIFWVELLTTVFGVTEISQFISFEDQVHLDHTSFIDGYIEKTHVMIEQKSINKSLTAAIRQSDGSILTPFEQAKRYSSELPYSKRPRWIVTSNFRSFYIYDMEKPGGDPEIILLENLEKEYYRLQFLVDEGNTNLQREMEVSIAAGEIVGLLYDALAKQYADSTTERAMKSLNILCVRIVFCLYAEDAGIFGQHGLFHDYLEEFDARKMRKAMIELFRILDTKPEDRDPYLKDDNPQLAAFPYVNGGLFANEDIEIPPFTEEIRDLLLEKASADFDWSEISPTIFGAVFESTLNPETRRSGGMHYTSIENIHKVIDPLFLDDLKNELEEIQQITVQRTKDKKLRDFQTKLANLRWLDPASGSGNFLTETYISIRRLENEVIKELQRGQISFGFDESSPIQVSIDQFYGIEINDFAVTVAKTALWIAESQMMKETEDIVHMNLDFLPLTTNAFIVEGNSLQIDWESVVPKYQVSYIMGNPPFVGYSLQSKEQKKDILSIYVDEKGKPYKTAGKIDYVAGWYFKAAQFMQGTTIRSAFVSTNSITQGEQVAGVWKPLYDRFGIHIDFAHRTFRWDSEANMKAHVHCVIVGFSIAPNPVKRRIYVDGRFKEANNINAYLLDAPDEFICNRSKPLWNVPRMMTGNRPADGGNLIIEKEDYEEFIRKEPQAKPYIKKLVGSSEFINNKERWCLWLVGVTPAELRKMPLVLKRVEACKQDRENSPDAGRRKLAETPTLFREINNPASFILVPQVSSERRRYVPMGFLDCNTISTNLNFIIPEATMYQFAILTSNIHMAWMRAVCGRLEMRYRYSANIVYNNFPWPEPTAQQRQKIEQTAQAILDARALYPDSSLADLYDELTMPPELRKAHRLNDMAVMEAYGFAKGSEPYRNEAACVAELMKLYQKKVEEIENR